MAKLVGTFLAILAVIALTGCGTARGGKRTCNMTADVVIAIDASGSKRAVVEDKVEVCHGNQKVIWIARGAKDLDIVFVKKAKQNPPPGKMGSLRSWDAECAMSEDKSEMRCVLAKAKHNAAGWLAYNIELVDAKCERQEIDPYLIIKR